MTFFSVSIPHYHTSKAVKIHMNVNCLIQNNFHAFNFIFFHILEAELQSLTKGKKASDGTTNLRKLRKAPHCKTCGMPRKGHKKNTCTPASMQ